MTRLTFIIASCVTVLLTGGINSAPAQKISGEAKSLFKAKYKGKSFRLRIELRREEPYVGTQFVDATGIHYPNYKQIVNFEKLETVAIENVGNMGGNFWVCVARQSGTGDRAVAAEVVTGMFAPPGHGESPIEQASRESMAGFELRIGGNPKTLTPQQQLEAVEALLKQVFYIDSQPAEEELRAFVREHPDYPPEALRDLTGLDLVVIKEIRAQTAPPPDE